MAKIYLALLDENEQASGCIIDIENLPRGTSNHVVAHPWTQGIELASFVKDDPARFARIIREIGKGAWGGESLSFVTAIASFWENLAPASEEKDGMLTLLVAKDKADFLRTSPAVANSTWHGLMGIV